MVKPVVVHSLPTCELHCSTKWILDVFIRYFMTELLLLRAVEKPQLPMFLSSWLDKSSAQCMYTMPQMRNWLVPHLKACCWYIDYGKSTGPIEEEDVKIACDKADSKDAEQGSDHIEVPKEENKVDLSLIPKKEGNRILK
jgi:hypothetical protein